MSCGCESSTPRKRGVEILGDNGQGLRAGQGHVGTGWSGDEQTGEAAGLAQRLQRLESEMMVTHAPPRRQRLVPGGEPLHRWGLSLEAGGRPLGPAPDRCGNAELLRELQELTRSGIPASLIDAARSTPARPSGPWFGEDLRGRACCSRPPVGGKEDLTGLGVEELSRRIWPTSTGTAQRPDRPRTDSWTDVLRSGFRGGERTPVKREEEPFEDRHDDSRPEPGMGGSSSSTERDVPRCGSGGSITPDELPTLANQCALSLGDNWFGVELRAEVPAGYVGTRPKSEMKQAFIPEWMAMCAPAGESDWAMANRCIDFTSRDQPGLFWSDGHGYYHRALMHAVLTMYGYREVATSWTRMANTCEMDADWIRRHVENRSGWIGTKSFACNSWAPQLTVDARGQVILSRPYPVDGTTTAISWPRVNLCARFYKGEAALADYYFWWTHRLYSYYMDGEGTQIHWLVGLLCARCALAEIVEIGAVILHESAHRSGSFYHCRPSAGGSLLGHFVGAFLLALNPHLGHYYYESHLGDMTDGKQDCCQWGLEMGFRVRLTAALGLPPSHDSAGEYLAGYHQRTRFNSRTGRAISGQFYTPYDCARSGTGPTYLLEHWLARYLVVGSSGHFAWNLDTKCSTENNSGRVWWS